ncbi:hypothetical protein OKA04_12905 [Luteolibacter flavescens]|uniref:Uncharacterized protein n=1 Tax=Luteolibacter flavescens TaxID=1859460 RepID=A0ABT3FPX6_9BACT|nr:hypothetical protein [Luteolibacter flavescens]MCW1885631.1 hypothetical protein [Luteolibacter flavescens]
MNEPSKEPAPVPVKPALLRCTVLITGTLIGRLQVAKGHRCQLPAEQAKVLASLTPPAVRIDGV